MSGVMSEESSPTPFSSAAEDLLRGLDALEIPTSIYPPEPASPATPTLTTTSMDTFSSTSSTMSTKMMERHPEFWFFDGSIVLVAECMMFRVHKAFLARHSVFFRDMFSLPQPEEVQEPSNSRNNAGNGDGAPSASSGSGGDLGQVDGCPTLRLHDSPDDVASLLYALYDGPKFGNNGKADFRVVSGILRLASKYIIESLRTKALEHLSIAWPSTLKGWDAREEITGDSYVGSDEPRFYPNPVEVINLAREIDAPNVLPSAFYDLSRYPLSDIFEQGTLRSGSSSPRPDVSLHQLSLSDTQKLVLGKEAAHYAVTALIRSMATEARSNPVFAHHHNHVNPHTHHALGALGGTRGGTGGRGAGQFAARHRRAESGPISRCASPAACWRDVCELVDLATQHYLFDRERGAMDPLYVAEELAMLKGSDALTSAGANAAGVLEGGLGEDAFGDGGTCKACARAFEVWARKERERLWKSIPGWFRLD